MGIRTDNLSSIIAETFTQFDKCNGVNRPWDGGRDSPQSILTLQLILGRDALIHLHLAISSIDHFEPERWLLTYRLYGVG